MTSTQTTQVNAAAYDTVREYVKENKYLSGLIKTYTVVAMEKVESELRIIVAALDYYDTVTINGIEYEAKK